MPRKRTVKPYSGRDRFSFSKKPLLTWEQEKALGWRSINDDDVEARRQLVEHNFPLVVSIAKKYFRHGKSTDIVEEGNHGLVIASGRFDPAEGTRFSTYATWWIEQKIKRRFDCERIVSVPLYAPRIYRSIIAPYEEHCRQKGKPLDFEELETLLRRKMANTGKKIRGLPKNFSATLLRRWYDAALKKTQSINHSQDTEEDNPSDYIDDRTLTALPDQNGSWAREHLDGLEKRIREAAERANITPRDLEIFMHRALSLEGEENKMTFRQIGAIYNLTRERIRQVVLGVTDKLRKDPDLGGFYLSLATSHQEH